MPIIALAAALALTVAAWGLASVYVETETKDQFTFAADRLEAQLAERMDSYEQVILGGVALIRVNGGWVSREQWVDYVATLELNRRFPGIQGLAFAEHVKAGNLSGHVERVRAEGFPHYAVYPEGERATYGIVLYIEPFDARNQRAFGFDMFSEPTRRAAMELARDSGKPALSGKVRLVQENGTDVQPGFLLYAPVYRPDAPLANVEERRDALVGYVFSPFRARDFMEGLEGATPSDLAVRIYDDQTTSPDALLYGREISGRIGDVTRTHVITIGQHHWTLVEASTRAGAPPGLSLLPLSVLLGGLTASSLLAGVVLTMTRTRSRAESLANEMTAELQARTRELEASNEALRAFSYVVSHDLKEPVRGIDAYLRVLCEDHAHELSPTAQALLDRAQLASDRMAGLLRGLLELSRVDRGLLKPQVIDIAELVAQDACRTAYEMLERERNARIEVAPRIPRVLAAPSVLAQALGNLIGNAIRHSARERPHVLVHGIRQSDFVEIIIEDDGDGFPPGFVEAFNRGQHPSMGFGLLIAQRAVERLHGRMMLGRGERLGGAQVRLILPAAPQDASQDARRGASRSPPRTRGSTSVSR